MRLNEPVTQQEYPIPENATLMSTTDTHSRITYANEEFIKASGFTHQELAAQPHNIVRHPDMPSEAFADMWATLKGGQPWTALVKNRRKCGDHYWVRANAVPVVREGKQVGYMSVRTSASRDEIAAAEALYRGFRTGESRGLAFHKGLIIRRGALGWLSAFKTMSVRGRIRLAMACLAPAAAALAWGTGSAWRGHGRVQRRHHGAGHPCLVVPRSPDRQASRTTSATGIAGGDRRKPEGRAHGPRR